MNETSNYLILFADLIGSTEVAVEVTPSFYAQNYIASYHWAARRAELFIKSRRIFKKDKFKNTLDKIRVAGDEVLSFSPVEESSKNKVALEDTAASAVAFAYITKLYWLASPYNLRRMLDRQFPRDIAVGIHIGPAALVPIPKKKSENIQIASLHINVTKRIENQAREGSESRIFASYDVADMFKGWLERHQKIPVKHRSPLSFTEFVKRPIGDPVKGVSKKLQLLELAWAKGNITGLINLLNQLTISPEKDDVDAESAARFLSENFLIYDDEPFRYGKTERAICHINLGDDTTINYIHQWFDAVDRQGKLFFDECWLVLNCYVISCAMLRHRVIKEKERANYIKKAHKIFERFIELIK